MLNYSNNNNIFEKLETRVLEIVKIYVDISYFLYRIWEARGFC